MKPSVSQDGLLRGGDIDVTALLREGDERELNAVRDTLQAWRLYRRTLDGDPSSEVVRNALDELAPVSAMDALVATKRLVQLIVGRQWIEVLDAREAGASWAEVGEALGVSAAEAETSYLEAITIQERYAADFHDVRRARAVLSAGDGR